MQLLYRLHACDPSACIYISLLQYRGCSLLGINACPDLDSQRQRFLSNGWGNTWAMDMAETYRLLPQDEVQRCVWFLTHKHSVERTYRLTIG